MQALLLSQILWNDQHQLNLNFTNALLVCSFIITVLCFGTALFVPSTQILIGFIAINILITAIAVFMPSSSQSFLTLTPTLQTHILLSISAYSILTFASIIAILFAYKDWQVKNHKFSSLLNTLPSLQSLERLLFNALLVGFVLLSAGLAIGFIDIEKWFTHKIVFTIIAWFVFAFLLLGRRFFGWRGKKAIKLTLTGMVFLLLAFLGSKLVLEVITKT